MSCYSVPPQSPHPLTKPPQLPSLLLLHHVLQTLSKPAEKCHASPEHNTATHRIRSSSFSTLAKVATLFFNKYKCPGPPCKRQTDGNPSAQALRKQTLDAFPVLPSHSHKCHKAAGQPHTVDRPREHPHPGSVLGVGFSACCCSVPTLL